ncbi:MAG TPA: hypothetical protein PLZ32_18120, partial [Saprospiraceae bacterium]|nr:hypothetical protein [Saprospiraceae bacterium]
NPIIITPSWLALKNLIREEESTNANVDVIHNDLVQYDLDWVSLRITRKRCEFRTIKTPYFDTVKDLASSIFQILKETPIHSIGINHIFELRLPDEKIYYQFGNQLTNLEIWKDDLSDARLMNLEIIETSRKDSLQGRYRVRISSTGESSKYGVRIDINDHLDFEGDSSSAVKFLLSNWENSFERSSKTVSNFIDKMNL